MEYVGIAELKAHLSKYLARVRAGEEIMVADRGRPVARLVPAHVLDDTGEEARLRDLERRGLIRMGHGKLPDEFWTAERPPDPEGLVRAALEEERTGGW